MSKIYRILLAVCAAVMMLATTSCSKKLQPLSADNFAVNPSPLVEVGGQVDATITVNYPEKYFQKKATLTITPVLVYATGEVEGESVSFQGEKILGNDKTINFKMGGHASFRVNFAYKPEMMVSRLCLDFEATTGSKTYSLPRITIADGVIATESLSSPANAAPAYGYDNFVKDTFDKYIATLIYQYESTVLRTSETRKDEMQDVEIAIARTRDDDRQEFMGIDMISTASPEGSYQLNERLANGREKASADYLQKMLKKARMEGSITPEQIAEDWEGFKDLVQHSNIQDKSLVLNVLSRITDPEQREKEIRNLSAAYKELADEILPQLRYSKVTATVKNIGHTNEEILDLWRNDRDALTLEELLYAATLVPSGQEQYAIFDYTNHRFPADHRASNNIAGIYFMQGRLGDAERIWRQIIRQNNNNPQANLNLGLISMINQDLNSAEAYLGRAGVCPEYGEAMGTLFTQQGRYQQALDYFGDTKTDNAAVAAICANRLRDARNILNGVEIKDGLTYYLQAIVSAREEDHKGVKTWLTRAVQSDASYRNRAKDDLEFAKFQDVVADL